MGLFSRIFLLFAAFAVFAACSPRKIDDLGDDPLIEADRAIDRGQYDRAIARLEELSRRDPRPRVRETLASAYAARAGLSVQKYWGFLVGFQAPLLNLERVETSPAVRSARRVLDQLDGHVEADSSRPFGQLARFFGTLELWSDRIDRLPTVPAAKRADVERALTVLKDIPSRGGRLYRALLGLIVFKTDITNGFDKWADVERHLRKLDLARPASPVNQALLCQINVKSFAKWAGGVIARLTVTARDVAVAFPSKASDMDGAVKASETVSRELLRHGEGGCL